MRKRRIILSSVACLAVQYFSTLSHKWHGSGDKGTEHPMCILIFSTTFVWNIYRFKKNLAKYDKKKQVQSTTVLLKM